MWQPRHVSHLLTSPSPYLPPSGRAAAPPRVYVSSMISSFAPVTATSPHTVGGAGSRRVPGQHVSVNDNKEKHTTHAESRSKEWECATVCPAVQCHCLIPLRYARGNSQFRDAARDLAGKTAAQVGAARAAPTTMSCSSSLGTRAVGCIAQTAFSPATSTSCHDLTSAIRRSPVLALASRPTYGFVHLPEAGVAVRHGPRQPVHLDHDAVTLPPINRAREGIPLHSSHSTEALAHFTKLLPSLRRVVPHRTGPRRARSPPELRCANALPPCSL